MARTAYLYKDFILKVNKKYWIVGYFCSATIICLLHLCGYNRTWNYSNPVVVIESFCLFFPFLYKSYYNKWINWIAASTFAVFIIHNCSPVLGFLQKADNYLLDMFPYYIYLPCYVGLIVLTFVTCILYDKMRIFLFQKYTDKVYSKLNLLLSNIHFYE